MLFILTLTSNLHDSILLSNEHVRHASSPAALGHAEHALMIWTASTLLFARNQHAE
jgi:hypothetical protein